MSVPDLLSAKIRESFWRFVDKGPACWLWRGSKLTRGYGLVGTGRAVERLAHRMSYRLHTGPIPAGLMVLHRCDVRACVNPEHLFLGTALDNTHDALSKGRLARGRRHGTRTMPASVARGERAYGARMTAATVRDLRARHARGESARVLAGEFGISSSQATRIARRQRWAHVL
jgi:hypothetical protein